MSSTVSVSAVEVASGQYQRVLHTVRRLGLERLDATSTDRSLQASLPTRV